MPNPLSPRDALLVKVDRANKHILNFQTDITKFNLQGSRNAIFHEDNLETGERTFYFRSLEIPPEFSASIGDILQNLRSALDHLAWHLAGDCRYPQSPRPSNLLPYLRDGQRIQSRKDEKNTGHDEYCYRSYRRCRTVLQDPMALELDKA